MEKDGAAYVQELTDGVVSWVPVTIGVEGDVEAEIIPQEGHALDENSLLIAEPGEQSSGRNGCQFSRQNRGNKRCLKNGEELPGLRKM